jgi:N-acetylmuramoyl-L-alanine amidase
MLSSCAKYKVEQRPSENQSSRIKALVFHYTASDFADALDALVNEEGGVSSHYLLPEQNDDSYPHNDLRVFQLVDENARAWHAGLSQWQGLQGLNDQSIGIELVNRAICEPQSASKTRNANNQNNCYFPAYDTEQIELLIELTQDILRRNPDIHPTTIVAHSDIAPSRKLDPGPQFPWFKLYQAGIGAWYEDSSLAFHKQLFDSALPSIEIIQHALKTYGYGLLVTGVFDVQTENVLRAFQTHFTPHNVSGREDSESIAALFSLLEKYFSTEHQRLIQLYYQMLERQTKLTAAASKTVPLGSYGQVDMLFPEQNRSTRALVNDRAQFKHYAQQGEIRIHTPGEMSVSADIFINGQKLNLNDDFEAQNTYTYSLARRTVNGVNTLQIDNVSPNDEQLRIQIPYPTLRSAEQNRFDFSVVDQLIKDDIAKGFPGAVLTIVKDGEILKQTAYGYRKRFAQDGSELANPLPMTVDTLFDIASNTKTFATSLAIKKLVHENKLALDKPIYHYLPEYRGQGRELRTVRNLLNHTSGYIPDIHFFNDELPEVHDLYSVEANRTKLLLTTQVPFANSIGGKAQYSDINFMLLGVLIERITQMPLDDYVEQTIYKPLGLVNTVFNPTRKLPKNTVYAATELNGNTRDGNVSFSGIRTYTLEGEVHDEKSYYSMDGVAGHAGLFSTGRDLATLAQLLLNGGGYGYQNFFSESLVNQFSQPSSGDFTMGLGFRRAGDGSRRWQFGPYASEQAFGHTGWTGTVTVIDPQHDLAIILLTNKRHSAVVESIDNSGNRQLDFASGQFETGKYGSVISLIYEAILTQQE